MYIILYADKTMEVREVWDISDNLPIGTLVYEPDDEINPWVVVRSNGYHTVPDRMLPAEAKAIEMLYPRVPQNPLYNNLCQEIMEPNYKR